MRDRGPRLLAPLLVLITASIGVLLMRSESSGTGAVNVGDDGRAPLAASPSPSPEAPRQPARRRARRCKPTSNNPGGTNNYIADAPERASLGRGFVITGLVRSARGCRPLEGVRVQVWLATETAASRRTARGVRTGRDGRYRIETAKTVAQFGDPNIHVGYDDDAFRPVFIRRVVDLDDRRAVVDLTLARDGS